MINSEINLKKRTSQSCIELKNFVQFEQWIVFKIFNKYYATGRAGSVIQSLHEPE